MSIERAWVGLLLLGLALPACAAARGRAAMRRGDHEDAAAEYQDALRRRPNSERLRKARDAARHAAIDNRLDAVAKARKSGPRTAARELDGLLELVRGEGWELDRPRQDRLDEQIAASAREDHALVRATLRDAGPLTARAQFPNAPRLVREPAYAKDRADVVRELNAASPSACSTWFDRAEGPHILRLGRAYCLALGIEPPVSAVPRPWACNQIEIDAKQRGARGEESDHLQHALRVGFEGSMLFDPDANCTIALHVESRRVLETSAQTETIEAPWNEQVPYTDTETYREPHQVAYTDTEYYSTQESYTTYESYTYSCGYNPPRTCTGSRPRTQYRTVQKSRPVTRYRTEYRTRTRTVTKYRSVPRVFEYEAIRHRLTYEASGEVTLNAASMAFPIEATWKTSERAEGLAHDSSFPAADVWPQQPNLPTRDGLVAAELDTVRNELRGRINGAVIRQACGNPQPSLDLAMACVLAKPGRIPASVANVLGTHTKEDPSVLLDAAEAHD